MTLYVCESSVGRRSSLIVFALACAIVAGACSKDPQVAKQEHLARGKAYVAEKKDNEAVIEFRNAVQLDARFGEARYELAEAYARLGDAENAYREYVRAADLLDDPQVQIKAGTLLVVGGRFEDAKARAEKALAADPNNVDAHILLGNAKAGLKDFDGAVRQMEEAIKADPNPGLAYASLGNFELQRGNRAEAEAAYAKAIELDPQSPTARVALGNYHLAVGNHAAAEAAFLAATELEPANPIALRSIVSLYIMTRQLDKAEPFLARLADESKAAAPSFMLADLYVATGRGDLASARLQKWLASPEDAPPAKMRLAAIDYAAGRTAQGHGHIDEVIKTSKAPQAYVIKARFLLAEQKVDEAIATLQAAVSAAPQYAPAQFWLAQSYLRQRKIEEAKAAFNETLRLTPSFVPAQIALSSIHLQAREADQALTYATQAVVAAPRDTTARVTLVRALVVQGNLSRATVELDALAKLDPNLAEVHVLRGAIQLAGKDQASAARAFARALEIDPKSYDALSGLVASQIASGKAAAAQAQLDDALAKSPGDATMLLIAARAQLAARDLRAAEGTLEKAIEADPQQLDAYTLLGRIYASQNRLDEAIAKFEELAKRQPNSVSAHTAVATLQLAQNRRAEAKARYQKVLDIDPRAAVAANNLAWMQAEDGDNLDVALQHAQAAVSRLPQSAEVNDTLGFVYLKKALYSQAVAAFRTSLKIDPKNPIYHYHLGLAYAKSGDEALARKALDSALALSPTFAGADDARATLATLGTS